MHLVSTLNTFSFNYTNKKNIIALKMMYSNLKKKQITLHYLKRIKKYLIEYFRTYRLFYIFNEICIF